MTLADFRTPSMYQQPLTQTYSTKEVFRSLTPNTHAIQDEPKLTAHDILVTLAQVGGALAACGMLHIVAG